ncbi:hypothetical protein BH11MYX4_BH11MYX4_48010 [soil metagenome]
MNVMVAKNEAATRHLPVAHAPHAAGREQARGSVAPPRRASETRLQAAVVADRKRDEKDPYADVPCTD